MEASRANWSKIDWIVCILLTALIWLLFGQTLGHGFVNYDDNIYVYENAHVTNGLTIKGIEWTFTHAQASNWQPITFVSHMIDCEIFGLRPGGHHFTSVLLHSLAAVLLFLVLRQMTGALWQSAFVAALFAVHPLRVESVAWIAERKDVLSGVFFMLALAAYAGYVRRPSLTRYLLVVFSFVLGLMSKPILVTLPFVLLLLDYWPLKRFGPLSQNPKSFPRLLLEKVPLILLSAASCAVTLIVQQQAIRSFERLSLAWRLENAAVSYCVYVFQMFWPFRLVPLYPCSGPTSFWIWASAAAVLVCVTIILFCLRRRFPCAITGWLWYIGMLVPVIGLIQVGPQAHADRYTYLPQIGLYIAIIWSAADLTASWRYQRPLLAAAGALIIASLGWLTWIQCSYWRDSETIWRRTLALTANNDVAENNLGQALVHKGLVDEAISHYQRALLPRPDGRPTDRTEVYYNLGNALLQKGDPENAIAYYRKSLEFKGDYTADAHNNLGNALLQMGQADEAIVEFQKSLDLRTGRDSSDLARANYNLGNAFFQKGRLADAIASFRQAVQLDPEFADAHNNLGNTLKAKGEYAEAIGQFQEAVRISPRAVVFLNNLAWQLAACPDPNLRDGFKALALAEQADQLSNRKNPFVLHTLAAACAQSGQFPRAVRAVQAALDLAAAQGKTAAANAWQREIDLYRSGSPYRDPGSP